MECPDCNQQQQINREHETEIARLRRRISDLETIIKFYEDPEAEVYKIQ